MALSERHRTKPIDATCETLKVAFQHFFALSLGDWRRILGDAFCAPPGLGPPSARINIRLRAEPFGTLDQVYTDSGEGGWPLPRLFLAAIAGDIKQGGLFAAVTDAAFKRRPLHGRAKRTFIGYATVGEKIVRFRRDEPIHHRRFRNRYLFRAHLGKTPRV